MTPFRRALHKLVRDESGLSLTEYGMIIAFIAVALLGVFAAFLPTVQSYFERLFCILQGDSC